MNLVPSQYRNVSVADVPVALVPDRLRAYFVGREVYRRTRYIVVRHGAAAEGPGKSGTAAEGPGKSGVAAEGPGKSGTASAVVEVSKESELPLFSPVVTMSVLAGPEETAFVDAPETDTAVPTQLARVALTRAPGARCVVVRGRYGHVSFILDPAPIRIGVVEVVPPWPPKLADQLTRVLELAEDLPPVELVPHLVDLDALAATQSAEHYLFPCRAGSAAAGAGGVSYLDEIPERAPWTLVGCARSKSIHDWFYGDDVPVVDMCPRKLAEGFSGPVITKCCLLEDRVASEPGLVVVPWGASLAQIRDGLQLALTIGQPVLR